MTSFYHTLLHYYKLHYYKYIYFFIFSLFLIYNKRSISTTRNTCSLQVWSISIGRTILFVCVQRSIPCEFAWSLACHGAIDAACGCARFGGSRYTHRTNVQGWQLLSTCHVLLVAQQWNCFFTLGTFSISAICLQQDWNGK